MTRTDSNEREGEDGIVDILQRLSLNTLSLAELGESGDADERNPEYEGLVEEAVEDDDTATVVFERVPRTSLTRGIGGRGVGEEGSDEDEDDAATVASEHTIMTAEDMLSAFSAPDRFFARASVRTRLEFYQQVVHSFGLASESSMPPSIAGCRKLIKANVFVCIGDVIKCLGKDRPLSRVEPQFDSRQRLRSYLRETQRLTPRNVAKSQHLDCFLIHLG